MHVEKVEVRRFRLLCGILYPEESAVSLLITAFGRQMNRERCPVMVVGE